MLKIRLSRTGKKAQPHYRIIVKEVRSKRDGDYLANLGYYIPYTDPALLKLNTTLFDEWLTKGAQPSEVVAYLRSKAKDGEEVQIKKIVKKKKSKKVMEKEKAAASEAEAPKATEEVEATAVEK